MGINKAISFANSIITDAHTETTRTMDYYDYEHEYYCGYYGCVYDK